MRHLAHRQVLEPLRQPVLGGEQAVEVVVTEAIPAGESAPVGGGQRTHGPGQVEAKLERAALPCPSLLVVGRGDSGRDSRQRGRAGLRRQPLRRAHVRRAVHSHLAVTPGLGRYPLHRVVAVVHLVEEGVEVALGRIPAPDVLYDDRVAVACGADGVHCPRPARGGGLVVRRPLQQRGNLAFGLRAEDVGVGGYAVSHENGYVVVEGDGVRGWHCEDSLGSSGRRRLFVNLSQGARAGNLALV